MSLEPSELDSLIRARILIVEDEGIVAKDLRNRLRSQGYTVSGISATGADAIAKAEKLRPDLILMDIRLRDEMDGIEAARRIREKLDVPIVFLTAYADPGTLARAADVGPYGYILKPFDERELHVTLIMALCKHRAFAELDRHVQERTAELARTEARYRRLQSVSELGLFALGTPDTASVAERAVHLVSKVLDVELVSVLELRSDGTSFLVRSGVGWAPGVVGVAVVEAGGSSEAGFTLETTEPVVVPDLAAETRFSPTRLLEEHGAASGMSVVIHAEGPAGRPYGVLAAHSRQPRPYSDNDANFLQAVSNVIATAIVRSAADTKVVEAERVAEQQRVRASLAEDALRARDEFLSVAAHELRTPVTALNLQMDALRTLLKPHAAAIDPRVMERTDRASKTVVRLSGLIEAVLDVSRIALGRLELHRQVCDLTELARDIIARHEDMAARAGCAVRLKTDDAVTGEWDPTRTEQVITNLLSNAIKFGAGKPIDMTVHREGDRATLTIRDRGEGIDPVDAHRIFRRFERAVSHQHYGGLGLGLYIASQIVQAHGGQLGASRAPGGGAVMTVVLPRAR